MQKIALITDSACDLDLNTLKENNINLLPLRIIYSNGDYRDRIDITPQEVYDNLENEVPKTSLPSAQETEEILTKLETEGYTHVICISISSGLSGSFNAIRLALEDHPKLTSFVYDSKILAYPQGEIVLEVAKLIKEGKSFEEIVQEIPEIRKRVIGYFTINTLEYLKKGGRIGGAAALFGSLLQIRPILTVEDGKTTVFTKVRTKKKAIDKIVNTILEQNSKSPIKGLIVHHINCESEGQELANRLKSSLGLDNVKIQSIGPIIGLHVGPGSIGVAYHY